VWGEVKAGWWRSERGRGGCWVGWRGERGEGQVVEK
jgi:hypothetical protein